LARTEPFRSLLQTVVALAEEPAHVVPPPVVSAMGGDLVGSRATSAPAAAALVASTTRASRVLPVETRTWRGEGSSSLTNGPHSLPPALVPLRLEPPTSTRLPPGDGLAGHPFDAFTATPAAHHIEEATRPDFLTPFADVRPSIEGRSTSTSSTIRSRLRRLSALRLTAPRPRPLPPAGVVDGSDVVDDKLLAGDAAALLDVRVCAFSSRDTEDRQTLTVDNDDFDTDDLIEERQNRAPAAVAIAVLSDEGPGEPDPFDAYAAQAAAGSADDLEVLASALGLDGGVVVPRLSGVRAADGAGSAILPRAEAPRAAAGGPAVQTIDDDEVEVEIDLDLDLAGFEALAVTHPGLNDRQDDAAGFLDDDEVTPPRGTLRPALLAPDAIRFVVAEAPARPRHEALTAEEAARNRRRARELYLVALDDVGDGDMRGAIAHLQLAVAYDDQTDVYRELLDQLMRKLRRAG
jgi:hypothetical protein